MIKLTSILKNIITEQRNNKKLRVLFVGDAQTMVDHSYARVLLRTKRYVGKIVGNDNASTSNVLSMLQDNLSSRYDVVSIMAGGKDGADKSPFNAIKNFEAMFKLVQNSGAKLVVVTNPSKEYVQKSDDTEGHPSNNKIADWLQSKSGADVVISTSDFQELDFLKDGSLLDSDAHKQIAMQWNREVLNLFDVEGESKEKDTDSVFLKLGSEGSDVIRMQTALVALGYSIGPAEIDGKFGLDTKNALEQFQRDVTIPPSGELDNDTSKILFNKASNKPKETPEADSDMSLASLLGTDNNIEANYSDSLEDQATALVAKFEGFIPEPSWDVNNWRIGYGSSTITDENGNVEHLSNDPSEKPDITISKQDAARDLKRRLEDEFIPKVTKYDNNLNNGTLAALVSVAYNYGSLPNSVVNAMNSGDIKTIAKSVLKLKSHNGGINERRRKKEAAYILNSK
jgi:GH24 family phage-related lysozyme (muramidase)